MFLILRELYRTLSELNEVFVRDPRVCNDPLMGPPWKVFSIMLLYTMTVKVWGPRLMANRPAYNVKRAILVYNIFQIAMNLYLFIYVLRVTYLRPEFSFLCQPCDIHDTSPSVAKMRFGGQAYFWNKILDFMDTVFFVLRKKTRQVSFLHVYHHVMMVFGVWLYYTLYFGSHFAMVGLINSFVHVCMYTYYLLSALEVRLNIETWKRRVTQLQIAQFAAITLHLIPPMVNNYCGLDMKLVFVAFIQYMFMLCMFGDFYYKAYVKKGRAAGKLAAGKAPLKIN